MLGCRRLVFAAWPDDLGRAWGCGVLDLAAGVPLSPGREAS